MRPLTPLCELAIAYETDKGGRHLVYGGQPSDTCHEYTPVYWDLFHARRKQVRNVLEVGINSGASLRMWKEFFPFAMIYGIDLRPECMFTDFRIQTILADQGNALSVAGAARATGARFDLIIDDGSHQLDHQIITMLAAVNYLTPDGIYVVEDMHADCHPEYIGVFVPPGFHWRAIPCELGIGKAHCWCDDCGQKGPEQLLCIERDLVTD